MKAFVLSLLCVLPRVAVHPAFAESPSKRVIITFKAKTPEAQREVVLQAAQAKALFSISSDGESNHEFLAVVAEVPAQPAMKLIPNAAQSSVLGIEEDYTIQWIEQTRAAELPSMAAVTSGLPKLTFTATNAALMTGFAQRPELTWGVERVKAPAAWDMTEGAGVRVAVIDTGIDSSHPDLQGKVDGGFDAITQSEQKAAWQDGNGHGTHVAGTIAALRDGKGVAGVAPKARLYAVRVLDQDGSGSLSSVINGIIWCAKNGIQVANMSLGSAAPSEAMQKALRYAKSRGVVVVASAGNSGGPVGFPGAYPEVIGVAASDFEDHVATFSSRGPEVDFIAPGVSVVSTAMGGGYANFSGTSMAAPHVTGLAALAVSQGWVGLDGPDGVLAQLKKAAKPLEGPSANEQGFGMIDAGRLVR